MSKRILLVDVDSKIPNIALGKLSAYHKKRGDKVYFDCLDLSGYPKKDLNVINIEADNMDKVYVSNIFECNQNKYRVTGCDNVVVGGIGSVDPYRQLPKHIEKMGVDYNWYNTDWSYGYITKGCIRKCYFCKVPKYVGKIRRVNNIKDIVVHKKVAFLDDNILAYPDHLEVLEELLTWDITCYFSAGLDVRLLTKKNAELLSRLKYYQQYTFAFDDIKYENMIERKVPIITKYLETCVYSIRFYIYFNYRRMTLSDLIYRIRWCVGYKFLPYVMRDANCWDSEDSKFLIDVASWCNQPALFKKYTFEEFVDKRYPVNKDRVDASIRKWRENSGF